MLALWSWSGLGSELIARPETWRFKWDQKGKGFLMDLVPKIGTVWYSVHCSKKGSYYRDRVPIGTFFTFWVPIFFSGSLFSVCCYIHANNVNSVCKHTAIRKLVLLTINMSVMSKFMHNYCRYWFCVSLLVNSNLFSCFCVTFYEQSV